MSRSPPPRSRDSKPGHGDWSRWAALAQGGETADRAAVEVLGNIAAMESSIELTVQPERFSMADLLEIHRVPMDRSPRPELGGVIRERQNWIGGSSYDPCRALFVQAAIAHARFETIHLFADAISSPTGTDGPLIHVILRR